MLNKIRVPCNAQLTETRIGNVILLCVGLNRKRYSWGWMDAGIERHCLKWGVDSVLQKGGVMKDSAATFVRLQTNTISHHHASKAVGYESKMN